MPIKTLRQNWKPFAAVLVHISHLSFCDSEAKKGKETLRRTLGSFTPGLMMSARFGGWPPQKLPPSQLGCKKELWASPWGEQVCENSCSPGPSLAGNPLPFSSPAWSCPLLLEQLFSGGTFSPTQFQPGGTQWEETVEQYEDTWAFSRCLQFQHCHCQKPPRARDPSSGRLAVCRAVPALPAVGDWGHQFCLDYEDSPCTLRVSTEDPRGR